MADRRLLIVGASVRAAAQSAVAAGFEVAAIDLFADADLRAVSRHVLTSRRFPWDVLTLERELPPADWLYVGGLENYPRLVERLGARRRLLGNDGPKLRRVRDISNLADWAMRAGVVMPESRTSGNPPPDFDVWLWKRRRSAAGLGVVVSPTVRGDETASRVASGGYWQRRQTGTPCGGLFLSDGRDVRFLGVAGQRLAPALSGGVPYRYGGSALLPAGQGGSPAEWQRLGAALVEEFQLVGLFGVDAIVDDAGSIWMLEVNPRPTASVELFERLWGISLIERHVQACRGTATFDLPPPTMPGTLHGKRIVYAAHASRMTPDLVASLVERRLQNGLAAVADISIAGTQIALDEPLATVFAAADSQAALDDALDEAAHRVAQEFRVASNE